MELRSQRKAYGETLVELGKTNKNIVVLEADLGKSSMSCLFEAAYPERYFEMGIAEANMASTAAGLSLTGKIPFMNSFAVFSTGRAYDQIRQGICIPRLNVKVCGASCGLSDFGDGSTHQAIEDVAIMRAIPNMTILVPADAVEIKKMVKAMVEYDGPIYMRIGRNDMPVVIPEDMDFEIGKLNTVRDGKDVLVFANGIMVSKALLAAGELSKEGISLKVVNASTVKPFDNKGALELVKGFKGVITAEEHSVIGGLGSAVCEALIGEVNIPVKVIGIKDKFGTSAHSQKQLLEAYGLTEKDIAAKVRKMLKVGK